MQILETLEKAQSAKLAIGMANTAQKNQALETLAAALEGSVAQVVSANALDLENGAKNGIEK